MRILNTYTLDTVRDFSSASIDSVQEDIDKTAVEYIKSREDELKFLNDHEKKMIYDSYTNTMETFRLIFNAIVKSFKTENKPGFPENVYNINLKTGEIEADKNGPIEYSTRHLAPCTTSMLHYINGECNDVFVICPPIKDVHRSIEKMILECYAEYKEARDNTMSDFGQNAFEEEPELPFFTPDCKLLQALTGRTPKHIKHQVLNAAKYEAIPKDIFRLSVTSKYPGDLEELIKEFEKKFPDYIKFEDGERNSYKKNLSENQRIYFDIKKTAVIIDPKTGKKIYVEFQFKQTCMFFAHIRSHGAYEEFRIIDAKLRNAKEQLSKNKNSEELKAKVNSLKKQADEKRKLCIDIHRSAMHQSNLYLMQKLFWIDENCKALNEDPLPYIKKELQKNYIVESYEPFDGVTAFATSENEYLNKAYYLKSRNILPESFDEFGKNAKIHINKAWKSLSPNDIADFNNITTTAVKYQSLIRSVQKQKEMLDNNAILSSLAEVGRL